MMRCTALLLLSLSLILAACQPEQEQSPSTTQPLQLLPGQNRSGLVVVDGRADRPFYWDFGTVPYGEKPTHVFKLKNTDSRTVTVHDLQANCGCTQPKLTVLLEGTRVLGNVARSPVAQIPAGGEAELEIAIDTRLVEKMNIDKLGVVRLRCDSESAPYLAFEVHIIVERLFRSVPARVELGEIPSTVGKDRRADLSTELAGSPAKVLGIDSIEGPFTATLDETTVGTEPLWILLVSAQPNQPIGPVSGWVRVKTTGPDGQGDTHRFEVPISGTVVDPIQLRPPSLTISSGSGSRARLECLSPGLKVKILSSRVEGDGAEQVRLVPTPEDPDAEGRASQWLLEVVPVQGLPARPLALRALLELDQPGYQKVLLPIAVQAR